MLFNLIRAISSGDANTVKFAVVSFALSLPIFMLALSLHEYAHGLVANKLGDPTAKSLGRLTLNPIKHIDLFGFISMLVFGFGWAKPVPINTRYFKKPKRDMAISAAAGPLSNLLLAFLFAVLLRIELTVAPSFVNSEFTYQIYYWLNTFLVLGVRLNVTLAVFNLIPVPPFDGSRIFLVLLPTETYFKIMRYEKYLYIILMVALLLGFLDTPINFVTDLFMRLIVTAAF